jgi:hypothetical protein
MNRLGMAGFLALASLGLSGSLMMPMGAAIKPQLLAQVEDNPCLEEPDSGACESYQMLQDLLQDREDRQEQALDDFVENFTEAFGLHPSRL